MSSEANVVNKPGVARKANPASISKIRMMTQIGMLSALATVLMLIDIPIPFIAPSFYKMDISELPVLIGTFAMGPVAGMLIELVKILLHLIIRGTQTAFVGEIANYVIGCAFLIPAGLIYKRKKTKKNAIIGLGTGTIMMAVAGVFMNALVLLPAYAVAFGAPIESFIEMGTAINPAINSIWTFVVIAVAPFNIVKGVVVSLLTILLYKHISKILKGQNL
ncbi:MAG: ECF transporter S component [Lachnospiraceae bacterium]|nr:ECF transporter S component [Lachnospiraceae bacterium]MDD3617753.1 ECF transporter S component [Lachnospiraceae bacterium]